MTTARHDTQDGFTLIELLVVILIIGILAAIALPAFLAQRAKGQDASAKTDARNMVSQLEACFRNTDGFVGCTAELTAASTSLPVGTGAGEVEVVSESRYGFLVTARSSSGNSFSIEKDGTTGLVSRSCSTVGGTPRGGCNAGTW